MACADASAARYHPVGQRALVRLRDAYGTGAKGLYLTPSLREDLRDRLHGVDTYAGVVGYSGLTLVACNWATDLRDDEGAPADADGTYGYALRARSRSRPGSRSCATTACGSPYARGQDRSRRPALRLRPRGAQGARRAPAAGSTSCGRVRTRAPGPTAPGRCCGARPASGCPRASGSTWPPTARSPSPAGSAPRRGSGCGRGVRFRFQPHEGGVRLIFPTERGDRIKYSVFFVADGDEHPTVGARSRGRRAAAGDLHARRRGRVRRGRVRLGARRRDWSGRTCYFGASDGGPVHIVVKPA